MRTRVEELFHEVADLSVEARDRHLVECDVDAATRRELEALLQFDSTSTSSLETELGMVAQDAIARLEQEKDTRCGPYQLGDLLGRGGMGTVHLADRVDGEISQRVAVKLLRPGVDDAYIRQRFFAERQILATLSHPNIARLLDAGHRNDGQPYLVMEYVDGLPIDEYSRGLAFKAKIRLFLKVCAAVGCLHRNLVVHRDLKPQNILVTPDGEPKLLDFGIAKMLGLTTDTTITAMRMLTPDYASPEQVTGGLVTTATDIYSLGALLYNLLTGVSPHKFEGDSVGAIALAISSGTITPPGRLVPSLKGDLEMIVMKALRREPQERYATIEQFSDDLENYLESRPIRARRGEAWYHTRKFLRRHWLPATAAVLAVAGLTAGITIANRERAVATRRFLDVRQLANKLFDIDVEARKVAGTTRTRQLIVDTSLEYLRRLSSDAQGDPELSLELGNAYMRVARVQGVPISQNLGQMGQAEQNLEKAETFLQSALKSQPGNRTTLLRLAQTAHDRMILARFTGHSGDALEWAGKSAAWLEKYQAGIADKPEASAILLTYLNVSDQHTLGGRFDDALRLCRHGSDLARTFNSAAFVGDFLWVSAEIYRREGDLDEALKETRESARILDPGKEATEVGRALNYVLALTYEGRILGEINDVSLGRAEEAVSVLERAFQVADSFAHQDTSDQSAKGRLAMAGISLADILRETDPRRALDLYDHVFRHMDEIQNNSSFRRFEVSALAGSTYALRRLGRNEEARHRLDAAFERLRGVKMYPAEKIKPGSEADVTLSAQADYEAGAGNVRAAIGIYTNVYKGLVTWGVKPETNLLDAVHVSKVFAALAALRYRSGEKDLGFSPEERRRELWRHWETALPHNAFVHRQLVAASSENYLVKRSESHNPSF